MPASPPAAARKGRPWRVRVARRVLTDDVPQIGHAAFELARKAITKKLTKDPEQYGERLHAPLHGLYKLKASHVRVAYTVESSKREVWVLLIGDRRTIWESREGEILGRLSDEKSRAAERGAEPTAPPRSRPRRRQ